MFSFEQCYFGGIQDKYSPCKGFESGEGGNKVKQTHLYGSENRGESGEIDSLCSDFGFYQENAAEEGFILSKYQQQEQQEQPLSDYGILDDLCFDIVSSPIQQCQEEITKFGKIPTGISDLVEPRKEKPNAFPLASLELLNNHINGFKRLNGEKLNVPSYDTACTKVGGRGLSTEEIMRVAGERFIQFSSQRVDDLSMLSHPFGGSFFGLSNEENKDVELAQFLLASAEKVGYQQFDRASKLLNQCDYLSSNTGNPIQRVVYYFSEALREKIDRETGRIASKGFGKRQSFNLEEALMSLNPTTLAFHQAMPFSQVTQFTGMQAIVENVVEAKKVHVIDLGIRNGMQWTVLMQALAARYECPIELLKITAIGTTSKPKIEETGKRLVSFAQTMGLPFSFKVVMVSDMLDLKEDLFELETEEAIAVYSSLLLRTMIAQPDRLESLIKVIRNINPCIMVVTEVESNHNSPAFVNRFIEALFFYSAFFDCLEACMDRNDPNRMITESLYFGHGIRNTVAAEGEERTIRHVKIDVWRAFFARFGMMETELSMSSLYQASLIVKKFACASSCMLDMDGKSLIIGWKGTPIHSISAWKFF